MQRLEVSGAVRPIYGSLGVKRLMYHKLRFIPYSDGTRSSIGIRLTPMSSPQSIVDEIVNSQTHKKKINYSSS